MRLVLGKQLLIGEDLATLYRSLTGRMGGDFLNAELYQFFIDSPSRPATQGVFMFMFQAIDIFNADGD